MASCTSCPTSGGGWCEGRGGDGCVGLEHEREHALAPPDFAREPAAARAVRAAWPTLVGGEDHYGHVVWTETLGDIGALVASGVSERAVIEVRAQICEAMERLKVRPIRIARESDSKSGLRRRRGRRPRRPRASARGGTSRCTSSTSARRTSRRS